MTEIVQVYLGNIAEANIAEQFEEARCQDLYWEVYLTERDCNKGRILALSTSGDEIGIIKSRDWQIREGDVFSSETGKLILIHLQARELMVLSLTEPINDRAIQLVHLGHILGNQHYPISIEGDKIYIRLINETNKIEQTIKSLEIPGLNITYEMRSKEEVSFTQHQH
jgi:urease accessory protein